MYSAVVLVSLAGFLVWIGTLKSNVSSIPEKMTSQDALWFPIIGSISLLGTFLALMYLPGWVTKYLFLFFCLITGTGSLYTNISRITQYFRTSQARQTSENSSMVAEKEEIRPSGEESKTEDYSVKGEASAEMKLEQGTRVDKPAESDSQKEKSISWREFILELNVVAIGATLLIMSQYILTGNWLLSNVIASSLAITTMGEIKLESVRTGALLLILLFFYDVFWVFFTPVMKEVAEKVSAPIKLIIPGVKGGPTMLGLGDIVIPGLYLCTVRDYAEENRESLHFLLGFIGYIQGLILAMIASVLSKKAQPALLYISPSTVIFSSIPSLLRGKVKQFFTHTIK